MYDTVHRALINRNTHHGRAPQFVRGCVGVDVPLVRVTGYCTVVLSLPGFVCLSVTPHFFEFPCAICVK